MMCAVDRGVAPCCKSPQVRFLRQVEQQEWEQRPGEARGQVVLVRRYLGDMSRRFNLATGEEEDEEAPAVAEGAQAAAAGAAVAGAAAQAPGAGPGGKGGGGGGGAAGRRGGEDEEDELEEEESSVALVKKAVSTQGCVLCAGLGCAGLRWAGPT